MPVCDDHHLLADHPALAGLVTHGLAHVDDVVAIDDLSRSHQVHAVRTRREALVVKRACAARPDLGREAAALRLGESNPDLAPLVPHLRVADRATQTLVTDHVAGHTAGTPAAGPCENGLQAIGRLAKAIGRWHRVAAPHRFPDADLPWPAQFGCDPTYALATQDGPGRPVLEAIARDDAVMRCLEALASSWTAATVIHGDLKTDNAVPASADRLVVVDWEMAGRGDPAWDVGCLVAELRAQALVEARGPSHDRTVIDAWTFAAQPARWAGPRLPARIQRATVGRLCGIAFEWAEAGGCQDRALDVLGEAGRLARASHRRAPEAE